MFVVINTYDPQKESPLEGVDERRDIIPGPHDGIHTDQVRPVLLIGPEAPQWLFLLPTALNLPFLPGGS